MKIYLFYSTIVKSNKINFTPITHASSFHGDKMACGTTLFYIYKFLPSTYFATHINTLKINNFLYLFTSIRTTILTKTDNFFTFSLRYTQQHWQKPIISLHTTTPMKLKLIIRKFLLLQPNLKIRIPWIYWILLKIIKISNSGSVLAPLSSP